MGKNNWTPEQWRAYNQRTGDRHVNRHLPPISQRELLLKEDLPQQRALLKLEHRRNVEDKVKEYRLREMTFIRKTVGLDE